MTIKKRKFSEGIRLKKTTNANTLDGEIRNDETNKRIKVYHDTDGTDAAGEYELVSTDQTQTLTNKTHTNPVLNGDVSGTAIDTDDTLAANSDTKIASQQAVKAYVDNAVAGKDAASEISYDNATSGLTATEVQSAIDEVEGRLDTNESLATANAAGLSAHLADTVDAHDASAISNVPSGNLAATDVQSALNELQTDIDTRALDSDLTAHLNDTSDAHDASAISYVNATSGLTATDAQAAIDEVEGRLDTAESNISTNASDLTTHIADTSTHGVSGDIVGTSDAQVLTAKDVDGGTASNTSRVTIPKNTKTNLDGLTRKEATVVYATDESKLYVDDGSNLIAVGSGEGTGAYNYITNGTAETDTSGWTRYANTTPSAKPDDFGVTPSSLTTWTRSTSTPLVGDASFLLTKDAVNRQGEGVYYQFTAEEGHKTLKNLLRMLADTSNANIADGDLAIYLVSSSDSFVADFNIIEPNNPDILAGVKEIFKQMQFDSSDDDYRLCIHIASTNATAYTAKFDNIVFGPHEVAKGLTGHDWKSFTPTGDWANTTYTGRYRRVGDSAEIEYVATVTGAVSGDFVLDMPAGLVMDTSKMESTANYKLNGTSMSLFQAFGRILGFPVYLSNTEIKVLVVDDAAASTHAWNTLSDTTPRADTVGDVHIVTIKVPIAGWSSNSQMSEDLGGREIYVKADGSNTTVSGGESTIVFTSTTRDTTNSFDGTTFTVPETGVYIIAFGAETAATTSADNFIANLNVGGSFVQRIFDHRTKMFDADNARKTGNGCILYPLTKGEEVTISIADPDNLNLDNAELSIYKLANPQTILETETVAARYTSDSGQTVPTAFGTNFITEDLSYDTHGAYNTSTGEYTIPISGWYMVNARLTVLSTDFLSAGTFFQAFFYVDGSGYEEAFITKAPDSGGNLDDVHGNGSMVAYFNKGQVITVKFRENSTDSMTLDTNGTRNVFSIARIK